jgi:hypothetical protein
MTDEAKRDRIIWTVLIVIGVIALIGAGIVGWRVMGARLDSARKLDQAIILVESADRAVIAIDEVVRAEVTPEVGQKALELAPTVATASRQLSDAVVLIDASYSKLNNEERRKATLLRTTSKAKLAMLEQAPLILAANVKVANAQPLAKDAWAQTTAADKLADEAVASYNKLTKAGVQTSAVKNAEAEKGFASARSLFSQAATAFPEAGMDRYVAYVDQKLVQIAISRRSDAAYLTGKLAFANSLIAAYNAADAKGVAMAKQLPASPMTAIADAYKRIADTATDTYFKARQKASDADQALKAM